MQPLGHGDVGLAGGVDGRADILREVADLRLVTQKTDPRRR